MTSASKPPLRVMFLVTSMPVGGAETLLMNLVRRLDREQFAPEIVCLKELGPLGEVLAQEIPVHSDLISHKFDLRVLPRLWLLMRQRKTDAVVTVGAGDKMFWGRLAARLAGVPVIASALHSTGWPDSVGRLNRLLTPLTDAFIGVADAHGKHLTEHENFPRAKVFTIYNGVDTKVFAPREEASIRQELGIPADAPVMGILAALRPEKNHELFLRGAKEISARLQTADSQLPAAHFVVIGDGERRKQLEHLADKLGISQVTHFLGSRSDVAEILPALDLVALTSHNEASPVSILESLSCGVPVVSARVGSVPESILPGETGELYESGDLAGFTQAAIKLLLDPAARKRLGDQGRQHIEQHCSLDVMVDGYEQLLQTLYTRKKQPQHGSASRVNPPDDQPLQVPHPASRPSI